MITKIKRKEEKGNVVAQIPQNIVGHAVHGTILVKTVGIKNRVIRTKQRLKTKWEEVPLHAGTKIDWSD